MTRSSPSGHPGQVRGPERATPRDPSATGGGSVARDQVVATEPFWRRKSLSEMTVPEWESLCDGCGRCCLNKLEDEDTGAIALTRVACRLLDGDTCRCSNYANRASIVPECIQLTPALADELPWLPSTCAYRLLAEGRDLPPWHPLVSGDGTRMHAEGISVRGWTLSESDVPVEAWEEHIIAWDAIDPEAGLRG